MSELLSLLPQPATPSADPASAMPGAAGMHAKLIKADFHGSIVTGAYTILLSTMSSLSWEPPTDTDTAIRSQLIWNGLLRTSYRPRDVLGGSTFHRLVH